MRRRSAFGDVGDRGGSGHARRRIVSSAVPGDGVCVVAELGDAAPRPPDPLLRDEHERVHGSGVSPHARQEHSSRRRDAWDLGRLFGCRCQGVVVGRRLGLSCCRRGVGRASDDHFERFGALETESLGELQQRRERFSAVAHVPAALGRRLEPQVASFGDRAASADEGQAGGRRSLIVRLSGVSEVEDFAPLGKRGGRDVRVPRAGQRGSGGGEGGASVGPNDDAAACAPRGSGRDERLDVIDVDDYVFVGLRRGEDRGATSSKEGAGGGGEEG